MGRAIKLATLILAVSSCAKVSSAHYDVLFGVLGVVFAIALSLLLYWATYGELTFESLLVGPECAVAAAGLGFHRILDYVAQIGALRPATVLTTEFAFYLSLVVLSIGAHLVAKWASSVAIEFQRSLKKPTIQPEAPLKFWLRIQYTISGWVRRVVTQMRLLNYLLINLIIGGFPMFLSAAGNLSSLGRLLP